MQPKTTIPNRVRDSSSFFMLPPCSNLVSFVWLKNPGYVYGAGFGIHAKCSILRQRCFCERKTQLQLAAAKAVPRPEQESLDVGGKAVALGLSYPRVLDEAFVPKDLQMVGGRSRVHPREAFNSVTFLGDSISCATTAQRVGSAIALTSVNKSLRGKHFRIS